MPSPSDNKSLSLLEAALEYAEAYGVPIIRLHYIIQDGDQIKCSCGDPECGRKAGKHPSTRHGVDDATTDPNKIRKWWSDGKPYNVGLACGEKSGFIVLDIDGEPGERSLAELERMYGKLPTTVEVKTPHGRHLYFKYDSHIKNSASKIAPGIDTRSDSGYVVAPPSVIIENVQ